MQSMVMHAHMNAHTFIDAFARKMLEYLKIPMQWWLNLMFRRKYLNLT